MARIEFPSQLKQLFDSQDSDLQAPMRALADRVGEILTDNKLIFFPDYTDHGIDHVTRVLRTEVNLVPEQIWERSAKGSGPRPLSDADAAVIIGATLLHDIAMHLHPAGFLDLIRKDSKFKPLLWFNESHDGHPADLPWMELWENYSREARRFSDRTLGNIIGLHSSRLWKFQELPEDPGQWELNHRLIIGEFIRRHHARLAHEIAIYGFPGLSKGNGVNQFPAMGREEGHSLARLADLIGLTARSHGTSLRVCQAYIAASPSYPGTPRPMGTAVLYPMALLRVADYLQIDRQRAPAVLLQLKNPQSPVSVQEWQKHLAVQDIAPAMDPRGIMVTVSPNLSLKLYLQLRELLEGLQSEMDHSTAVLDEAYGLRSDLGLNSLTLATRRVYSNLHSPVFRKSLPYVPEQTGFSADPNLLTLLVEPLYGNEPSVGVRELMQNAADAVCELDAWCAAHKVKMESLNLPSQNADVLIDFIKRDDESWFLRVQDRGIGMTSDVIQNFYLRAGASFRQSADWSKEFLDEGGQPRVIRAGRFGVGAFAVFLLGPTFRLWTRHATAEEALGYFLEASADSHIIEIRRVDGLQIGTRIEVELSSDAVRDLDLNTKQHRQHEGSGRKVDWFCWDWPSIKKRVIRGGETSILASEFTIPVRKGKLGPEWAEIKPTGFDAVYWTFAKFPDLVCNGLRIAEPRYMLQGRGYSWSASDQLQRPRIAVLDSAASLPLTTQRYELSQATLPFEEEITRDVFLSFVAHALICGPSEYEDAQGVFPRHPLSLKQMSLYDDRFDGAYLSEGLLRWCSTSTEFVPADPWLYSLLNAESCLIWGCFDLDLDGFLVRRIPPPELSRDCSSKTAVLPWHAGFSIHGDNRAKRARQASRLPAQILGELAIKGVAALGHTLTASHVLVSSSVDFEFSPIKQYDKSRHIKPVGRFAVPWSRIGEAGAYRSRFYTTFGDTKQGINLEPMLGALEEFDMNKNTHRGFEGEDELPDVMFVAELNTMAACSSPSSVLATVWNECLGPKAIPFDSGLRNDLVIKARKHPELRVHIEAWEELKRKQSPWSAYSP